MKVYTSPPFLPNYSPVLLARPRFSADISAESLPVKPKVSLWQKLERALYVISPVSGFIGGAGLMVSAALSWFAPALPLPQKAEHAAAAVSVEKAESVQPAVSEDGTRSFLQQLAGALKILGVAGASTCYGTIGLNTIGMGLRRNQPSIFLGGVVTTAGGLLLQCGDPLSLGRACILASVATFNAGYANMLKQKKPTDPIRECHMAPIMARETEDMASRLRKVSEMLKFTWDDHKLMVVDIGNSLKNLKIKTLPRQFTQEAGAVLAFLRGKQQEVPATLQKQPGIAQSSGLIMYAAGVPLFFLGGNKDTVTNTLMAIAGAGRFLGNLSLVSQGVQGKKLSDKAFLATVPMGLVGGCAYGTDWGLGMAVANTANVAEYLRQQAIEAKPEPQKSAPAEPC